MEKQLTAHRPTFLRLWVASFTVAVLASFTAFAQEPASAQGIPQVAPGSLEAKIDELKAAGSLSKKRGIVAYLSRLGTLRDMMQSRGNLDGLLAVDKELKRIGKEQSLKARHIVDSPSELRSLMKIFYEALEKQRLAASRGLNQVVEAERARLQGEVTRLTQGGEIAEAIKAREALNGLDDRIHAHLGSKPKPTSKPSGFVKGGEGFSEKGVPLDAPSGLRRDPNNGSIDLLLGNAEEVPLVPPKTRRPRFP